LAREAATNENLTNFATAKFVRICRIQILISNPIKFNQMYLIDET